MKNTIPDKLVLECFLNFQHDVLDGDGIYCMKPYQRIMKRTRERKEDCLAACKNMVERGFLNPTDGLTTIFTLARTDSLITAKGKKVLGIRRNVSNKPKGPELLIEGWKWK